MIKIFSFNKTTLAIYLSLVVFSFSCSNKAPRTVVEFWTLSLSPTFNNYFYGLIARYESANPHIKIKWVDVPYDAVIQKLLASISADNPPDVVNLSSDFLAKFNSIKSLVDISKYISTDSLKNIYLPNALSNCTIKDKIVGLPWYLNTYALIYNKHLVYSAGFTEKDIPKTFLEFISFIKSYKDKTGKYASFVSIGKDSFLPMFIEAEGVHLLDSNFSKAIFNSPEAIKIISRWVDLYKQGYLPSESIIQPGSSVIEPYQSGKVALVFTGPVFLQQVKDNAPQIYKATEIAPVLIGSTGKHELAAMSLSIMKKSKNKKEAIDFLLYLTNAENQLAFCKLATIYPSVTAALKDSFFVIEDGTLETKAKVMGARLLPFAGRLQLYLQHPRFNLLRDAFDEMMQNACLNKMSVNQAVDIAIKEWDQILSED
jgi:putative chitobiose transport system substrate-binding protein